MASMGHTAVPTLRVKGFAIHKGFLLGPTQRAILDEVRDITRKAPLFSPITPSGKPMSVRMTSAGEYGWFSDQRGYRYERNHPNGSAWPEIPSTIIAIWRAVSGVDILPDSCLVNFYQPDAKMGLHQDKDEADLRWPVVSISLGDDAQFRMGGTNRGDKTDAMWLSSGDVVVMGGAARLAYHGVDRIKPGTSGLLPKGGRINLTLRVVA